MVLRFSVLFSVENPGLVLGINRTLRLKDNEKVRVFLLVFSMLLHHFWYLTIGSELFILVISFYFL